MIEMEPMMHSLNDDFENREPVVRERSTFMTDSDAKRLCGLFADGLETGMGFSRILDMMERQGFDEGIVNRLRNALTEKGDMLGEAFARYGMLDPASRKLILVAEQQGKLPGTFRQLSDIYGKRFDRKKRFFYSMVEPAILIVLGLIVARNLFSSDLMQVTFEDNTREALQEIFIRSGIECLLFASLCAFIVMISMNLPVDFSLRSLTHRIIMRLPIIGEAGSLYAVSTFCRYVKQSLASGLTAYRALELAAEASNAPKLLARIGHAQKHIADGGTIAQALYKIKAFPDDVIEAIDIGEESGHLEERLDQIAERYEQLSHEAFERFISGLIYTLRMLIVITAVVMVFLTIMTMDFSLD